MTDASPPVYVLGDANLDVLMPIDEYPAHGQDKRSERTVIEAGGSAANTAICLAKLGLPTALLACVGQDVLADLVIGALRSAGVQLDGLQSNPETTGIMFIPVTPDGQRTLFGRRGANRFLSPEELPMTGLSRARALHLSGYAFLEAPQAEAARRALSVAAEAGAFLSMDTAYEPPFAATEALRVALPPLDLLIVGEREALTLSDSRELERAVDRLLAWGVGRVAVKRGERGSLLFAEKEQQRLPAFPVETVDSTGAGDGFSAALLYGLLAGFSLAAAGLLAAAAGALATTQWGAGSRLPGLEAIVSLLTEQQAGAAPGWKPALDEVLERLAT